MRLWGEVALHQGRVAAARERLQESAALYRQVGDRFGLSVVQVAQARVCGELGDRARACASLAEAVHYAMGEDARALPADVAEADARDHHRDADHAREVEIFEGLEAKIVSKEDAILSKLLWTMRGSSKSREDVRGMLLDPTPVDERLLQRLADRLGCADLLREIRSESKS